jgi:hypothetical protein
MFCTPSIFLQRHTTFNRRDRQMTVTTMMTKGRLVVTIFLQLHTTFNRRDREMTVTTMMTKGRLVVTKTGPDDVPHIF